MLSPHGLSRQERAANTASGHSVELLTVNVPVAVMFFGSDVWAETIGHVGQGFNATLEACPVWIEVFLGKVRALFCKAAELICHKEAQEKVNNYT